MPVRDGVESAENPQLLAHARSEKRSNASRVPPLRVVHCHARLVPPPVAGAKRIVPAPRKRRPAPESEIASLLNYGLGQTTRCRTQKYWQSRRCCKKKANDFPFTNKDSDRIGKGRSKSGKAKAARSLRIIQFGDSA